MNLLMQILNEVGADTTNAYTVVPSFGAYLKNVKTVLQYSPQQIVVAVGKSTITVDGENLIISKFFQGDMLLTGNVVATKIE